MNQDFLVITAFLAVTVSVPSFIAVYVFNLEPSLPMLFMLCLSSFLAIHPAFGFNIPSYLKLQTVTKPQLQVPVPTEIPKPENLPQQTFSGPDRLIEHYDGLKNELLDLVDLEKQPADGKHWQIILTQQKNDYQCSVQKKPGTDFFFRIVVDFEATMEETFDLVADIEKRKDWDELTQSAGLVERTSFVSAVQFMKTKEIWPTAARDALVMAFAKKLDDGRYINVTKSIDSHPKYTSKSGHVRMLASIAGLVVGPHPSGDPKRCRCIQVVNGDLGGWLPASVVSVVTTQAFPISMRRANTKLKKIANHKTVSDLILFSEGKGPLANTTTPAPTPAETGTGSDQAMAGQVVKKSNFLSTVFKYLKAHQPWMVFAILLILVFKRR